MGDLPKISWHEALPFVAVPRIVDKNVEPGLLGANLLKQGLDIGLVRMIAADGDSFSAAPGYIIRRPSPKRLGLGDLEFPLYACPSRFESAGCQPARRLPICPTVL